MSVSESRNEDQYRENKSMTGVGVGSGWGELSSKKRKLKQCCLCDLNAFP